MADPKAYAVTYLGSGTSLELEIAGDTYDVCQFVATWATNEVPAAQALLAIGRDVNTLTPATIHVAYPRLRQMQPCKVVFRPKGEYDPSGTPWPPEFTIFDGYFMGFAYSKVNGKVQVIANLKHWLLDLTCSSTLTQNSHPLNPYQLTSRAVGISLEGDAGSRQSHYISQLVYAEQLTRQNLLDDLWGGIKKLFCSLTQLKVSIGSTERERNCGGTGNAIVNTRAARALKRMEGLLPGNPLPACDRDYLYGVPLRLDLGSVSDAQQAVAQAISHDTVDSYATSTFWDKLVREYCSSFHMAVVPTVDRALVVADTPSYRGGIWRTVGPEEYDSLQQSADLDRPLRAVGVVVQFGSCAGVEEASGVTPAPKPQAAPVAAVGGCYAENIADNDDGTILYVRAPSWLQVIFNHEPYAGSTTGLSGGVASRTDTTPDAAGGARLPQSKAMASDVTLLLNRYAQTVYVANTLRGRNGLFAGRLRFDIAPGSMVKLVDKAELFLGGEDSLAATIIGCVNRVTTVINAESAMASTTFVLSHIRTEKENEEDRTSVAEHPLFGRSIHGKGSHGCPLIAGHEDL